MKSKDISLRSDYFLNIANNEYGEIGDFMLEDDFISFSVYRAFFEEPTEVITVGNHIKLIFIDKFDDPVFSLVYKIVNF